MTNVIHMLLIYFLASASSVLAVALALLDRHRYMRFSTALAFAAISVSCMGLTAWTPFGVFPEFGYSWSNGPIEIAIRSGWLFVIPLVVAAFGVFLALRNYRKHDNVV
jgi:hypothetical protein